MRMSTPSPVYSLDLEVLDPGLEAHYWNGSQMKKVNPLVGINLNFSHVKQRNIFPM